MGLNLPKYFTFGIFLICFGHCAGSYLGVTQDSKIIRTLAISNFEGAVGRIADGQVQNGRVDLQNLLKDIEAEGEGHENGRFKRQAVLGCSIQCIQAPCPCNLSESYGTDNYPSGSNPLSNSPNFILSSSSSVPSSSSSSSSSSPF